MSALTTTPDVKRIACAALGIALGVGFVLLCPDIGLSGQGVRCLGILFGAVVWWVGDVVPAYATAIVMVVLFAVVGGVESSTALTAFTSDTWWLLLAAFGIGAGMKGSGLLKRIALAVVRTFPNTFAAQTAGLMLAGTVVGPLVPSMAAKVTMLTPLSMGVGDALGYERFGKPMQGLFLAMFCGVRSVAPMVLSASAIGYCLLGLLPADVQAQFDMLHWALAALPWFAIVTVLTYGSIVVLYRPKGEGAVASKRAAEGGGAAKGKSDVESSNILEGGDSAEAPSPSRAASSGRGTPETSSPMSPHEKQMCAIILVTVALWVLEPLHHVPAHIVALTAFVVVVACGILGKDGLRKDIAWEPLVLIGIAMGLPNVFGAVGIQEWAVQVAGPAFEALAGNPYLFVLGAAAITLAMRFLIVSEMAYLNIVMVFLVPLCTSVGFNPWVAGFAMYAVITPWFVMYQSATYMAAYYSVDGQMASHADLAKYCVVYTLICMLALVMSVPYWQWMGLL